jgi:hypothetical protein
MLEKIRKTPEVFTALFAALVSIIVHTLPFILYGNHPLGYDTGFYRRYLIQPFTEFPNTVVPGLGDDAFLPRLVLDILRQTQLPPDLILYGSYIACFALLPILAFFLLRQALGVRGALIGALLLSLSPVSYQAFWFMLWKNAWTLCLLLGAFIALERRAVFFVYALEIGIALSHKTTALVYLLTLAVLFVLQKERRKEYAIHIAVTAIAFLAVNLELAGVITRTAPSAIFLGWNEYTLLSLPFIAMIFVGFFLWKTCPPPKTLMAFAFVGILFTMFRLPFYERIFIFTDVALALLATFGIEFLVKKIRENWGTLRATLYILALCAMTGVLFGTLENQIKLLKPLMTESNIAQIESVGTLVPEDAILLTTTEEAPWFEGFTLNHIAAPGMLADTHNLEEWTAFWEATTTEARIEFLNDFPQPLYISTIRDFKDLIGEPIPCLKEVSPTLLKSACREAD